MWRHSSCPFPMGNGAFLKFDLPRLFYLLSVLSLAKPVCQTLVHVTRGVPENSSSSISRPFRIERKLALTCLNTQTTLQYKPHKRATKMVVTILIDINDCNNNISINNQREGRILFFFLLFYCFYFFSVIVYIFVFLGYYTTFCLVLYISLSVFVDKPLRERGDGQSPHPSWNVNFWS